MLHRYLQLQALRSSSAILSVRGQVAGFARRSDKDRFNKDRFDKSDLSRVSTLLDGQPGSDKAGFRDSEV